MSDELHAAASSEVVKLKLDQLAEAQKETAGDVKDIRAKLIEPPDGLFIQVNDVRSKTIETEEKVATVKTDLDKLVEVNTAQTQQLAKLETWAEDHARRDDELREHIGSLAKSVKPLVSDYDRRMSLKKWTDKIIWAILAVIITAGAATIKRVFVDHDHVAETERLRNIERMLEREESRRDSNQ